MVKVEHEKVESDLVAVEKYVFKVEIIVHADAPIAGVCGVKGQLMMKIAEAAERMKDLVVYGEERK